MNRKIKTVYSVWHLDDFFRITANWISLYEPKKEPEKIKVIFYEKTPK